MREYHVAGGLMGNPFSGLEKIDLGSIVLRNITDWISGAELRPDADPYDVQDRYNQQRDGVRSRTADIGFQGQFRPREVLDIDEFERHDVAALRGKVDHIDLNSVGDLIASWNSIADRAQASLDVFTKEMARGTDESVWRGAARDAAVNGVRDYAAQGAQVSNAARLTSGKLAELRTGLEPTKQLVPHAPQHQSGVDNFRSWVAGRGWRNDDVAEHNAKTEALRVLRTVYAPVVMESDINVPVIPRPAPATNPGDSHPVIDNGGNNSGGTATGGGRFSGTSSSGSNPSDSAEDSTTPTSTRVTDDRAGTPQSTTDSTSTTPASTTPASTAPAPSTVPSTTGSPLHGTPGSIGSPASPTGPGAPGVSVPPRGTPNTSTAAPAAATAPGRAGMGGAPGGMGTGARNGKSDEESSKGIPEYLITQEHGDELTGLADIPKAVPPVIGE
ncbi:hypothetical protein AB0C34_00875 [Nocardia sp. NPDC049220]|uniref:hypothetical protein n=1 Tax=Nocardia sp. NPDC049220 TaxID=3155273 RepID=UPI0033E3295D